MGTLAELRLVRFWAVTAKGRQAGGGVPEGIGRAGEQVALDGGSVHSDV